jgi:hypothetical protein
MRDHLHPKEARGRLRNRNINGYQPATPRAALGLTAVAMATITVAALVVLPAKFDSLSSDPYALAAAKAVTKAPIEVATNPERIDAPEPQVADREEHLRPDHAALGVQESFESSHKIRSLSRTDL